MIGLVPWGKVVELLGKVASQRTIVVVSLADKVVVAGFEVVEEEGNFGLVAVTAVAVLGIGSTKAVVCYCKVQFEALVTVEIVAVADMGVVVDFQVVHGHLYPGSIQLQPWCWRS